MANPAKSAPARIYGGLSSEERRAERRSRLLEAGLQLFGTLGYPAVAIPAICSHSGVTARHFYEEFASREALLKANYDDIGEVLFARISHAIYGKKMRARKVVRAGCEAYVEYLTADPRRARIFSIEVAGISRDLDEHRSKTRRRFARLNVESSQRLRELAFDPGVDFAVVATLLTGAADAMMGEWVLFREPSISSMIDTLTTIWLRALQIEELEQFIASGAGVPPPIAPEAVKRPA